MKKKKTKPKIYLEIGDFLMVANLRYPTKIQMSGVWLIHKVVKTRKTIELKIVLQKKGRFCG